MTVRNGTSGVARHATRNALRSPMSRQLPLVGCVCSFGGQAGASSLTTQATPRYQTYEGDDPVGFTISQNKHRRHMPVAA
jgi:hypothetical protein